MHLIKTFIKFLSSKILTLKFLERLSQNIIRRNIIAHKNPKIVSTAVGNPKNFKNDSWNEILRYKVWEKVPEYIDANKSLKPNNNEGNKRCAELDMGKNSVKP